MLGYQLLHQIVFELIDLERICAMKPNTPMTYFAFDVGARFVHYIKIR